MSDNARRTVAAILAAALLAILVSGTYLPYRKSKLYVQALQKGSSAKTVNEFLTPFMIALNSPSPVGRDEMTRNFVGTVGSSLQGAGGLETGVVRAFALVLDQYALPAMERRSALSATQLFFAGGGSYLALHDITGEEVYRERGQLLLLQALELSPDRPQTLYALFDDARKNGDEEGMRKYGNRIMELWDDPRVADILDIGEEEATTTGAR